MAEDVPDPTRSFRDRTVVASEFARVAVSVDEDGNGDRLQLEDLRTGRTRYLDALELETIIWLSDGHLQRLLDPSADRWKDSDSR
jgi:hypothetical protein